jgi:hypothetical protein
MNFPAFLSALLVLLFPLVLQAQAPVSRTDAHLHAVLTQPDQLQEKYADLVWRFEEAVELQDEKSVKAMLPDAVRLMEQAIEAQQLKVEQLKAEMAANQVTGSPALIKATQTLVDQQKILAGIQDDQVSFFSSDKKEGSGMLLLRAFEETL